MTGSMIVQPAMATVTCDARDYDMSSADIESCHERAAHHRDAEGHRVLVIEITTTSYEASP